MSPKLPTLALQQALAILRDMGTSPLAFVLDLLADSALRMHSSVREICERSNELLDALQGHIDIKEKMEDWAHRVSKRHYTLEILELVKKENGWHFDALKSNLKNLEEFDVSIMATKFRETAPHLWDLTGQLLIADPVRAARRQQREQHRKRPESHQHRLDDPSHEEESDDEYDGVFSDDLFIPEDPDDPENSEHDIDQAQSRKDALLAMKQVVCISVFMRSTNQKCNALQSAVSIFLHSCNTPDTVIQLLSRFGISTAQNAINTAITSLSNEISTTIQKIGRGLNMSLAYDNIDIEIKHAVPQAEKPADNLVHLTSGTFIPLSYGVNVEDLRCSEDVWRKSRYNRRAIEAKTAATAVDVFQLADLHPDREDHPSGLSRRSRFNAWKFLSDLVNFGPEYFRQFASQLGEPEVIKKICEDDQIQRTKQIPLTATKFHQGRTEENIGAVHSFMNQGGVGDVANHSGLREIREECIIGHGDLLTVSRVQSIQLSRSLEDTTPWLRLQFLVMVPGLFHLKMACCDAIWRIFISPTKGQQDANSLMSHIGVIRPKQTGTFASKTGPGFRRMHEVVQHVGTVLRLDCWRLKVAASSNGTLATLDAYAESKPLWGRIVSLAMQLAREHVANETFVYLRSQTSERRDKELENTLLRQKYFLLYEEMSYAMNAGDIGRVEDLFLPWAYIFKGCGGTADVETVVTEGSDPWVDGEPDGEVQFREEDVMFE
ncbi:hypothetical protein PUNSTDRAFT_133288 [Punctularia strigosozonata HHB-11173 SS5]|uniref:uncharacterized protein n=1 Tax=Punctularia strigosozonata (strain HHB-11173) TaxID=741275 RepID=UPI0004416AA2|nr:uncharacterized protein PUNSTDRAFT_133288 [Punctularia strigosozonata HHB-11173 SS5]EIN09495.1 hypothetical protein PUNSTDRAFT_133288 [Punctularia strigosozonata HHB-11173 SS5]